MMKNLTLHSIILLTILLTFAIPVIAVDKSYKVSEKEYELLRKNARERKRKVIFNNDGCDVLYYPEKLSVSKENFLARRTSFLAPKCDTLMYCPISAGQGNFTLPIEGADLLLANPPRKGYKNIAATLIKNGDDYFQWLIDYCHQNKMEIFFSFRMNDTHDQRHTPQNPSWFFSNFKNQNRHLLFGKDHKSNPPIGWWTSLDFAHKEVRNRQVALTKAILDKYDVDGIDLDFSRYLKVFKRSAYGQVATIEECNMMTSLIREIRKVIDDVGRKRGKAILLSIVLPDDIKFCRNLGYDIATYFKENLIDIWQQGDFFQINPIKDTAAYAKKNNVKFYSFAGSPYPYGRLENNSLLDRRAKSAYAGRLSNAIYGKADGIYLYNVSTKEHFDTATTMVSSGTKRYFVTNFTWEIARAYCLSPKDYQKLTQLTAHVKCAISPNDKKDYFVEINEPIPKDSKVTLFIDRSLGPQKNLIIWVNGKTLKQANALGRYESFTVPANLIKTGFNKVAIQSKSNLNAKCVWFEAKALKDLELNFFGPAQKNSVTLSSPGVFTINGSSKTTGFAKRFATLEFTTLQFSFACKLNGKSAFARFSNSGYVNVIQFLPNKLFIPSSNTSIPLKTKDFQKYTAIMKGEHFTLFINGKKFYEGKSISAFSKTANINIPNSARNYGCFSSVIFGVPGKVNSSFHCKDIVVDSPNGTVQLNNLMVEVTPNLKEKPISFNLGRSANKNIGNRILDERALPFAKQKGKKLLAGKISLISGSRKNVFVVSNSKQVAAYIITNEALYLWPNTVIAMNLNNSKIPETYLVDMSKDSVKLYCNGTLVVEDKNSSSSILTPKKFLSMYGNRFTKAEQKVILNGGLLVRGLKDYTKKLTFGKLLSSTLYEIGETE